jgi:cell division septation protein DedD
MKYAPSHQRIPERESEGNPGETMPTPEPLPLPPTPGNDGTQGSISGPDTQTLAAEVNNATRGAQASGLSAEPEPMAPKPSASAGESLAMAEANDGAAIDEQATPPSDEPAAADPDEVQPPKAKAKQKAATSKAKAQKSVAETAANNGQPLVLVPPEEPPPPPVAAESITPSTQDVASTTSNTTSTSGLFGNGAKKLTGKRAENAGSTAKSISTSQKSSTSTQDQVASIDTQQRTTTSSALVPESAPAPKETTTNSSTSGGTGYVAQVASLRSETEARAELDRLRGSYGSLIGNLSTRITKATVAGTTRYRLGFGPLPSRSQAAKLCSSLIAAGERDCAVRGL